MSIGNSPEDERPFEDVEGVSEEVRPSIGRALQQARIAAGLTVDDVSTATRVRITIVHAIEADDFAPCGGDVYARGHIRTLAKHVHLDPDPLLEQYDAERGGRPAPTPAAPLFEAERIRPERRGPNWTAAMVAAIVAVIGFAGFTLFKGDSEAGSKASVAEGTKPSAGGSASSSADAPKPTDSKPDPTESAIAAAPGTRSPSRSAPSTAAAGSPPRTTTAGSSSTACSSRASPRPSRTVPRSTWCWVTRGPSSCT
ncbi:hypothetical protein GCM10020295_21640 [Streptomyces cinereospinus]